MGVVYRQKGRSTWMLKYYRDGRPIYESSGTDIKDEAKKTLKVREGDIAKGVPITSKTGRVRFDDAAKDLVNEYTANNRKSLDELERRLRLHLTPYFGNRKLSTISTPEIREFILKRQKDVIVIKKAVTEDRDGQTVEVSPTVTKPVSNGEINRELTILKRMFTLAIQAGKILYRPHIPMLQEDNVRTGFFEQHQYDAVMAHLPAPLQPVITFAYVTGWRITSEVLPLQWRHVDLKAREVRLDPGTTKNKEGRTFKLTTQLHKLLEAQKAERDRVAKESGQICPWVFFRMVAEERGGDKKPQPILKFNKAWAKACAAAGCPGRIPHDLRRTAVRNMVRAGVPERVSMKLTGHKTRSVFERYNIVSDGDLNTAATLLDASYTSRLPVRDAK